MDFVSILPGFLLAVLLIASSPGPAVALILRRAAVRGTRAAVPTVLGLELGLYAWALAAGAGLAAVVAASHVAYLALRIGGAGFLIFLGVRALLEARRLRGLHEDLAPMETGATARGAFAEGLVVQLANPKAAVFMFAFYPQFVPTHGPVLAWTAGLALVQVSFETALYLGLAAVVGRASGWFRRTRVRRRLETASGTVLVGLGLKVAVTR